MERDEAARSGLHTRDITDYQLVTKPGHSQLLSLSPAEMYKRILTEMGITRGRVALYGKMDAGQSFAIFSALQAAMPELTLVGETDDSLILAAMATKDEGEVARIRRMGQITTQVVGRTADLLTSQRVQDHILIKADGAPLTIGEVKNQINLWLAELGAENPDGTIFAHGPGCGHTAQHRR